MLWFDPCVASQAVLRLATICNLRLTGNPGFLRICLCLQTPGVASLGRIGGKSPAVFPKPPFCHGVFWGGRLVPRPPPPPPCTRPPPRPFCWSVKPRRENPLSFSAVRAARAITAAIRIHARLILP